MIIYNKHKSKKITYQKYYSKNRENKKNKNYLIN